MSHLGFSGVYILDQSKSVICIEFNRHILIQLQRTQHQIKRGDGQNI